jgi:hypothetical protein
VWTGSGDAPVLVQLQQGLDLSCSKGPQTGSTGQLEKRVKTQADMAALKMLLRTYKGHYL